jgi:hypothetical protein
MLDCELMILALAEYGNIIKPAIAANEVEGA